MILCYALSQLYGFFQKTYLYAILTCAPFLYQINCAGGFPPRLRHDNSTVCPRRNVSDA